MLPVSHKELDKAFRRHKTSGDGDLANDSKLLLLVYAAECGLKRVLLERRNQKSTARLADDDLTHDLNHLLRRLGEPPKFPSIQIDRLDGRAEQVSVDRLHEALRYGVRLIDREKIAKVVRELLAWIEEDPQ